jgi:hypothetical protein
MQQFEVEVKYTTTIVGRDQDDALIGYKDWLDKFTFNYNIISIKHKGDAW